MSINKILSLLPKPIHGVEKQGGNWLYICEKYGINLPEDFKAFIAAYGTGSIENFLWVLNPFSKNINLNFEQSIYYRKAYEYMREDFPDEYFRPCFPKLGSFFTWAVTDNGDSVFWIVCGTEPDSWKVGIHSADQGEEELSEMTTSEFLETILNNTFESSILPKQFLVADKKFYPVKNS